MKYHDAKELYIDLLVEEALEIPEEYNCNYNISRNELIEKLSKYLDEIEYHRWFLKNNTKITIHYYYKNNAHNLLETDTERGKEIVFAYENNIKDVFVYYIDNDGNIYK